MWMKFLKTRVTSGLELIEVDIYLHYSCVCIVQAFGPVWGYFDACVCKISGTDIFKS